eukprot:TRINITY_DN346_c0_g1_i13.p1 TRINITY_DN346_c0_g1~~TRINITY_DN346_c0_g1_i13.p1  ORF type:complete len:387 (-),score=101.92 TRINITY_DN346_c0_g1_i13:159-1319(-)
MRGLRTPVVLAHGYFRTARCLRLRDQASCWRATARVLHHCLRDKVIPVRLAAHELFREAFDAKSHAALPIEDARAVARELLGAILERLGDSNLRLHESARACVARLALESKLLGLRRSLALLRSHLEASGRGRERTKVCFGILDTVSFLLQQPAASQQRYELRDVAPFVRVGLDDALGPRVRSLAVNLAVAVRAACGREAETVLLDGQRAAVRALLTAQFAMLGDEDDDDLDDMGAPAEGASKAAGDDGAAGGFVPPANLDGLLVVGTAVRPSSSCGIADSAAPSPLPLLPGAVDADEEDDEDLLMDGILEETGQVFGAGPLGSSLTGLPSALRLAGAPGTAAAGCCGGGGLLDLDAELLDLVEAEALQQQRGAAAGAAPRAVPVC